MVLLDQVGVNKIVLMATGARKGATRDQLPLAAYEKHPDRVIPFLGLNGVATITGPYIDYLDRELATGKFFGMGELMARHYGFSVTTRAGASLEAGDYTLPMDSPGALDLMCLAAKHNVVLIVHMETTAETVPGLERALQQYRDTKVTWAHQTHIKTFGGSKRENARKADPGQIAALMDKYPNLYADIALGFESSYLARGDGRLPEKWESLYEGHSSRFVVGLDRPFLASWEEPEAFLRKTIPLRKWLSQLSPTTQRKLATENMERILAAKPSSRKACQFLTK